MTTYTWKQMHPSADYLFSPNWIPSGGPPGANDVAEFDASTKTNISIVSAPELKIGEWLFNPGATQYNFEISWDSDLIFFRQWNYDKRRFRAHIQFRRSGFQK